MISAKEAREQTELNLNQEDERMLIVIEKGIRDEIDCNRTSFNGLGYLSNNVKNKLKQLGYVVEQGSQYNEQYYSISW